MRTFLLALVLLGGAIGFIASRPVTSPYHCRFAGRPAEKAFRAVERPLPVVVGRERDHLDDVRDVARELGNIGRYAFVGATDALCTAHKNVTAMRASGHGDEAMKLAAYYLAMAFGVALVLSWSINHPQKALFIIFIAILISRLTERRRT